MKTLYILVLGGALACSPVVLADAPFDAGKLGYMRGVLDTCSSVAPQQASAYLLQMKTFVGSASRETVSNAMRTDEYQQAYQSIRSRLRDEMSTMSRNQAAATCASYLTN